MIFDQKGTTTIAFQEVGTPQSFLENLNQEYDNYKEDNLILNLLSYEDLAVDDVIEFLTLSNTHRASKKSFVLVTDAITYDDAPQELIIVPSLQEAHDIIEMEEIERDLGF